MEREDYTQQKGKIGGERNKNREQCNENIEGAAVSLQLVLRK